MPRIRSTGFTLVELVLVVLIIGVIASIALPKFVSIRDTAEENATRKTLSVYRSAIFTYQAVNGSFPAQDKKDATFKSDLAPFVHASLPESPYDHNGNKADVVKIRHHGDPLVDHVGGDFGWLYDNTTGEFIINCDNLSSDGITKYCEF